MLTTLYLLLAGVLWWGCFCRASRMSKRNTLRPVRWAFAALAASATLAIYAPLATAYQPDWVDVVLLAGIVAVQVTTSRYWHHGVPDDFRTKKGPPCA